MRSIEYIEGDLFSNTDAILLHACNCHGRWGRGVAATFAEKYPLEYKMHQQFKAKRGDYQVIEGPTRTIICLFTSKGYGRDTDPAELIVMSTAQSLDALSDYFEDKEGIVIASPKINAGLFQVPWPKTEALINQFLERHPTFVWKVYCQ